MTKTIYYAKSPNNLTISLTRELSQKYQKNFDEWILLDSDSTIWYESFDGKGLGSSLIANLDTITKNEKMMHWRYQTLTPYLDRYNLILYQKDTHLETLRELLPKDEYSLEELAQ